MSVPPVASSAAGYALYLQLPLMLERSAPCHDGGHRPTTPPRTSHSCSMRSPNQARRSRLLERRFDGTEPFARTAGARSIRRESLLRLGGSPVDRRMTPRPCTRIGEAPPS
jgi:hypothetical protein